MKFDPKTLRFEFETKEEADAAMDIAKRIVFTGDVFLGGPEAPELVRVVNAEISAADVSAAYQLAENPMLLWTTVLPFRIAVGVVNKMKEPAPVGTPAPVLALVLLEETLEKLEAGETKFDIGPFVLSEGYGNNGLPLGRMDDLGVALVKMDYNSPLVVGEFKHRLRANIQSLKSKIEKGLT